MLKTICPKIGAPTGNGFTCASEVKCLVKSGLVKVSLSLIVPFMEVSWPKKVKSGNATVRVYRMKHATSKSGWTYVLAHHEGGVRKRKKFADLSAALAEARLKADQLNAGFIDAASMTAGDRAELQSAREICKGIPLLSVLKEWEKANSLAHGQLIAAATAWNSRTAGALEAVTVADAVQRFLKAKKREGYSTADTQGSLFAALVKSELGPQTIASVGKAALQAYLDRIGNRSTRNTHRKRIVTLWRWARSADLLPRDTLTEAERTTKAREDAQAIGIIDGDTLAAWLAIVREKEPQHLPALVLSAFCGMRRGEVHGQTWESINLTEGHLHVVAAKEGTPANRLIDLCPVAKEWLMLTNQREGPVCDGLPVDRVRKLGRDAKLELPENCTRHSWISYRVAETRNIEATSLEAGNTPAIIRRHYLKLRTAAQAAEWFGVSPSAKPSNEKLIKMEARRG